MSLLFTDNMARQLQQKEQHDVLLWAHAMERVHRDVSGDLLQDPLIADIMSNGNNIPFIITDENLEVINFHLIPEEVIDHPRSCGAPSTASRRRTRPSRSSSGGPSTTTSYSTATRRCSKSLYYFPYVQITVITAFILLGFVAFRSSKHDEQNRVWIGLAKETAHQLGTPTSSLLGWIEYLRSQPRRSGGRGGDEQGPGPPDEDRGPLLEDRFRDTPHPGQHQRNGG